MRTKIISAFPGTGKSYYCKNKSSSLDLDSTSYSWKELNGTKVRNKEFPENYIKAIKDSIGKYEYIFVSSHKQIRDALLNHCLFFYLIYPDKECKKEYIQRYKDRGNTPEFIKTLDENWDNWIDECEEFKSGFVQISLQDSEFIADVIQGLEIGRY